MKKLTHIDDQGKVKMVDIGHKPIQYRIAKGEGYIRLNSETIKLIKENSLKKGDVLAIAEIAGIQGAKQTSNLIPLCHLIQTTVIKVQTTIIKSGIKVISEVKCLGQTGAEMEALTAVNIALLTIYDMCKAVDKKMVIGKITLTEKSKKDMP